MKKLKVKPLEGYKSYLKDSEYELDGDLIILSGINGSGKSQLLKIIAKPGNVPIKRIVTQFINDQPVVVENTLLLSFRDNIDLGTDFGAFTVTYHDNFLAKAWEFYSNNIKHNNSHLLNDKKAQRYREGTLIFNDQGIKHPSWRSIIRLTDLLKQNFQDSKVFNLTRQELDEILPMDFIWRNENDIIGQVGNLFYIACCKRAIEKMKCGETTDVFNNEEWLKTAPWTILNELFEDLKFKYRFKTDYSFNIPYMEENPKLRDGDEIRSLTDLSDGEKAILKLALIALDEEISKDLKLVLFDEYEAPLNPSLTEAFYYVINKFYLEKGIQVLITTHSPATISLAPPCAEFYEIFSQENASPKIVKVNRYDYEELGEANKTFYDKIKNQEKRILELENISKFTGNLLLVEDTYDQIYKIAYLKIKGIDDLTEDNLEQKFSENANFSIHGSYSCGGLYNELSCHNFSRDHGCKIVCLFDFDTEGYSKFKKAKDFKLESEKIYNAREGSVRTGLFIKHKYIHKYALLLPIPERLEKYVSTETSSDCFIEVETLIDEEYLKSNPKAKQRSEALPFYKMRDNHKNDFWKDLLTVDKEHFKDFKPLFDQVDSLMNRE